MSLIMQQYNLIKQEYQDYLVFFRLGDFYELFYEDAKIASQILNITLTKRVQKDENIPMSGVPFHTCNFYISKLVKSGYKIALCEQVENSSNKQEKIIKREVVRIITPGTVIEDNLLEAKKNNFLISLVCNNSTTINACVFDLSTNEIFIETVELLKDFLEKIDPSEILINQKFLYQFPNYQEYKQKITLVNEVNYSNALNKVLKFYKLHSTQSLEYLNQEQLISLCLILDYIELTQKQIININLPYIQNNSNLLLMDKYTRRNLEITKTLQNDIKGSILWLLDETKTAQGGRLLQKYINNPITDITQLNQRYQYIENFIKNTNALYEIIELLTLIPDFERLITKIMLKRFFAYDLLILAKGILCLKTIIEKLNYNININTEKSEKIIKAISETPFIKENFININFDSELDELKTFKLNINEQIAALENAYQEETKVNLRIKLTPFGYLVETNNSNKEKLNYKFTLFQNLKTVSRYITDQLDLINKKLNECDTLINLKEQEILNNLAQEMLEITNEIKTYSIISAEIDLFTNFANLSIVYNFVKPTLTQGNEYEIKNGFHPILLKYFKSEGKEFVSNNCNLNKFVMLMTGPNMAGKSTYLRQQAIIILLAHIGMFIPAQFAKIGIVDQLFCRISTNDNLLEGNSTFMMEMIEISLALNTATNKSFLILDEVGRGTSVEEGQALAQSILEYLLSALKARTLFATHFLNLQKINHDFLQKQMMQIFFNPIHFSYKLVPGVAEKSYAFEIAKLAGLKTEIIERAAEILG